MTICLALANMPNRTVHVESFENSPYVRYLSIQRKHSSDKFCTHYHDYCDIFFFLNDAVLSFTFSCPYCLIHISFTLYSLFKAYHAGAKYSTEMVLES